MQLIAPDILIEARGLSYPFSILGIVLGVLLWVLGWRWHRFWIVFFTTTAAGVIGLNTQQALGPRMLAAGLLLAVAAGLIAIDLSRLIAFLTCGLGTWFIVHAVVPTFQEPLICVLAGGILGLFLYRLQWMLVSSLLGVLLAAHSVLLVIEMAMHGDFVAAEWAGNNALALTIGVAVVAVVGLAVQGQIERWYGGRDERLKNQAMSTLTEHERAHLDRMRRSWFGFLLRPAA